MFIAKSPMFFCQGSLQWNSPMFCAANVSRYTVRVCTVRTCIASGFLMVILSKNLLMKTSVSHNLGLHGQYTGLYRILKCHDDIEENFLVS